MMVITKYKCQICGRVTDPEPEHECEAEQTLDDICDECKNAVLFVRRIMSGLAHMNFVKYDESGKEIRYEQVQSDSNH